jgi:hydroxypyruvate isomerase
VPRFSANISLLFADRPVLERIGAARAAGFAAVEIQDLYDLRLADVIAATERAGVAWALFNVPIGDMRNGGPGFAAVPGREGEFRAAVDQARRVAEVLRPHAVNVMAGFPPPAVKRARAFSLLADNLRYAADVMAEIGVKVLVEALNARDRPGFLLARSADMEEAVERAGHPNLGIQYDLYHMQIMEGDLVPTIERLLPRIGHIQFADTPGRGEPGTGEINFAFVFDALDRMGYAGWVGAEYKPTTRTEDTLGWMARWR